MNWPAWGFVAATMGGLLVGSHQLVGHEQFPWVFNIGYWAIRASIAYLLFAGCLVLLETSSLGQHMRWPWLAVASALATLMPFTLSITMIDLILNLPELGLDSAEEAIGGGDLVSAFLLESFFHLDNYLVLCGLIVLPRVLFSLAAESADAAARLPARERAPAHAAPPGAPAKEVSLLDRCKPSISGEICAVQAQEHYIRVVTARGATTALYRFGDAVRELKNERGMQVHRSHWVSDRAVKSVGGGPNGLKITLSNGDIVPVSARYADSVRRRYADRAAAAAH